MDKGDGGSLSLKAINGNVNLGLFEIDTSAFCLGTGGSGPASGISVVAGNTINLGGVDGSGKSLASFMNACGGSEIGNGGQVTISASQDVSVISSGAINCSATRGVAGNISVTAVNGTLHVGTFMNSTSGATLTAPVLAGNPVGGTIQLSGAIVNIDKNSKVDASGFYSGGSIAITANSDQQSVPNIDVEGPLLVVTNPQRVNNMLATGGGKINISSPGFRTTVSLNSTMDASNLSNGPSTDFHISIPDTPISISFTGPKPFNGAISGNITVTGNDGNLTINENGKLLADLPCGGTSPSINLSSFSTINLSGRIEAIAAQPNQFYQFVSFAFFKPMTGFGNGLVNIISGSKSLLINNGSNQAGTILADVVTLSSTSGQMVARLGSTSGPPSYPVPLEWRLELSTASTSTIVGSAYAIDRSGVSKNTIDSFCLSVSQGNLTTGPIVSYQDNIRIELLSSGQLNVFGSIAAGAGQVIVSIGDASDFDIPSNKSKLLSTFPNLPLFPVEGSGSLTPSAAVNWKNNEQSGFTPTVFFSGTAHVQDGTNVKCNIGVRDGAIVLNGGNGCLVVGGSAGTNLSLTSYAGGPGNSIVFDDLDLSANAQNFATAVQNGQIQGNLFMLNGSLKGAVNLQPGNLGSNISSVTVPSDVTANLSNFQSANPINVAHGASISGNLNFIGSSGKGSDPVLTFGTSWHSNAVLINNGGAISSDGSLTINADNLQLLQGKITANNSIVVKGHSPLAISGTGIITVSKTAGSSILISTAGADPITISGSPTFYAGTDGSVVISAADSGGSIVFTPGSLVSANGAVSLIGNAAVSFTGTTLSLAAKSSLQIHGGSISTGKIMGGAQGVFIAGGNLNIGDDLCMSDGYLYLLGNSLSSTGTAAVTAHQVTFVTTNSSPISLAPGDGTGASGYVVSGNLLNNTVADVRMSYSQLKLVNPGLITESRTHGLTLR